MQANQMQQFELVFLLLSFVIKPEVHELYRRNSDRLKARQRWSSAMRT